jgi:hypothetical protein
VDCIFNFNGWSLLYQIFYIFSVKIALKHWESLRTFKLYNFFVFFHVLLTKILPTRLTNCLFWVCYRSAQAFLFAWYVLIKCLTIVQAIGGKFPGFFRLFFYILVAGIYVTKSVQFVSIFADLFPVKCHTKFCYRNQFF